MAITQVDSAKQLYTSATTDYDAPRPTTGGALVAGDVILAQINMGGASASPTITKPSDWTEVIPPTRSGSTILAVYSHVVTSGEVSSPPTSWQFTSGTSLAGNIIVARFRGVDAAVLDGTAAVTSDGTSSKVIDATSILNSGAWVISGVVYQSASTHTATLPSGFTEIAETAQDSAGAGAYMARRGPVTSTGSTGTATWVITSTLAGTGYQIALRPSGGTSGGGGDSGGTGTWTRALVGNPRTNGFTVSVKTSGATSVRVKVSTSADLTAAPVYSVAVAPSTAGWSKHTFTSLNPNTTYYYGVEMNGTLSTAKTVGTKTLPLNPSSFKVVFGSCNNGGSSRTVWDAMRAENPAAFLHLGDWHYADINSNNQDAFRTAVEGRLDNAGFADLLQRVPVSYITSDHDNGPNNSGVGAWTPAVNAVYREVQPHPALPGGSTGLYHSFVIGRVRFIMLDCRSFRSSNSATDNSSKTMLGATQKAWFKDELLKSEPVKVIAMDVPWIGAAVAGDDDWTSFTTERTELANFISSNGVKTVILHGDAHMLAADSGANAPGGMPVFAAAPFNQSPSVKGGPYSEGTDTSSSSNYGLLTITDASTSITIAYQGKTNAGVVRKSYSKTYTVDAGGGTTPPPVTPGTLSWAPPTLSSPETFTVSGGNWVSTGSTPGKPVGSQLVLDDAKDYIIDLGSSPVHLPIGLNLRGGRNVVCIGGTVDVEDGFVHTNGETMRRALYLYGQVGTIHIEGVYFTSSTQGTLTEGVNMDQRAGARVVLQHLKFDHFEGSYSGHHADGIQTWAGPDELFLDDIYFSTGYQGAFMLPLQQWSAGTLPTKWDWRRVSFKGNSQAGYAIWSHSEAYPWDFSDVQVRVEGRSTRGQILWDPAGMLAPVKVLTTGEPTMRGSTAGVGYVSLGYGATATPDPEDPGNTGGGTDPGGGGTTDPGGGGDTGGGGGAETPGGSVGSGVGVAYPFDGQSISETLFSRLFREYVDSGVVASADSNDLRVTRYDGPGLKVAVGTGMAIIRGHALIATQVADLTIGAPGAATRRDTIALRLDPTANTVNPVVIPGTAGSANPTPLAQTESGIFELPLAYVTVVPGAATIAEADIEDARDFVSGRVGVWANDSKRPRNPRVGRYGLNLSAGRWEFWNGSAWQSVASTLTWTDISGAPSSFSPAPHNHAWTDITGKPSTFAPSPHTHGSNDVIGTATYKVKSADQTRSSTAIADDQHLFVTLAPGVRYEVEFMISALGSANFKTEWTGPSDMSSFKASIGPTPAESHFTQRRDTWVALSTHDHGTNLTYTLDDSFGTLIVEKGWVQSATGGTLRFRWGCNDPGASTVLANSYVKLTRMT